jgi:hypothetical protein
VPNTGTDAMRATSPLTESDFLDIVDRAEALREVDRLLIDNAELSTECDQWQKKLAETWAELAALAALRDTA